MLDHLLTQAGMLIFLAILVEAITEVIKNLFPQTVKDRITYALSILVGVGLAYGMRIDLFGLAGSSGFWVSVMVAGIIASRGANYVSGIMKKIGMLKR